MTTVDSVVNSTWKYLKMYPEFVFGTGYDSFSNQFKYSWKKNKNNLSFRDRFSGAFKEGTTAAVKHNDRLLKKNNGSFWKATKNSITSIWPDLQTNWKTAGEAAKAANKSVGLAKFKSIGKVLGKRMPLIGAVMTLGFELPNIIKSTANEGVLAGVGETAKTGFRLGLSTICGALTQALIPVPFLGGMVGFVAGDMLGRLIVGKSYSEKKAAETQAQTENNSKFSIDTSTIPYGGTNFMNDDEFMKLQQAYLQSIGQTNNMMNFNNPYSTSNPFGNFNMIG